MLIKKYEVTILHDSIKTKQFACPVQITIMKKLELNKEVTKNAAILSNSLLKIC